ncbi:spermidine synthase [Aureococcus anophagefferens]|nr:spermidine synthase [Aureococcus anophagefferens]
MSSTKKDKKFYHATAAQAYYMKPSEAATWLVYHRSVIGVERFFVLCEDTPELAALLLRPPWNAFVDATFVAKTQRDYFVQMDRQAVNVACAVRALASGRPDARSSAHATMRWSLASPAGSGTVAAVRAAYVAAAPTRVTAKTWSTVPSRLQPRPGPDPEIWETREAGRVLVVDGAVRLSEADERPYHEMLSHVAVCAAAARKRRRGLVPGLDALAAGGGALAPRELAQARAAALLEDENFLLRSPEAAVPARPADGADFSIFGCTALGADALCKTDDFYATVAVQAEHFDDDGGEAEDDFVAMMRKLSGNHETKVVETQFGVHLLLVNGRSGEAAPEAGPAPPAEKTTTQKKKGGKKGFG